ncbi:Nuclear pore complex protein Nup98-Nup96 [Orchesella cincta]|uniref:Nuclear pore complex protein Nup98-Nup96 n=1 Tax=Orchesella cincta TaxID=48709 RepID=A0A1D2M8V6_ORCCI|nr:Nuclear pore complex protein Nup98-Nup96 [Orchesella cincta]
MQPNNQALVPFATTPFKDSPLFSNPISTTSLEKMTKPSGHKYLDSRRKEPRHSVTGLSVFSLDSGPFWSNFKNMAPSDRSSAAVRKKPAIFEDEDEQNQFYVINLLAPKITNHWKRLILNSAQAATRESNNGPSPAKVRNLISQMTVKDGVSFSFNNATDSETGGEAEGGDDAELEQRRWATKAKFKNDLNKSISGIEARRQNSTGCFRISQIVDDPEPVRSCGVVCTRPGYYINPSVEELDKMMNETGKCFVVGFEIGRHGFGKVNFILPVNVAGLNVDETVIIEHQSIEVYPEGSKKPLLYEGLNGPALVELERIWPINKETKEPIRCLKKIYERGVEKKLKKTCADLGVEFISYNDETGVWKFQVSHF